MNRTGKNRGEEKEIEHNVALLVTYATLQIIQGEWHLQCTASVQCSCGIYLLIYFIFADFHFGIEASECPISFKVLICLQKMKPLTAQLRQEELTHLSLKCLTHTHTHTHF